MKRTLAFLTFCAVAYAADAQSYEDLQGQLGILRYKAYQAEQAADELRADQQAAEHRELERAAAEEAAARIFAAQQAAQAVAFERDLNAQVEAQRQREADSLAAFKRSLDLEKARAYSAQKPSTPDAELMARMGFSPGAIAAQRAEEQKTGTPNP